jgi:hypothetical protein
MTSLQKLPPPIARLFTRIDSADATDTGLRHALDYWQERRSGRISPSKRDLLVLPADLAEIAFVALPQSSPNDWRLTRIGAKAFEILQPTEPRGWLTKLGNRAVAVRLRRLLQLVSEAGEPVAGLCDLAEGPERSEVEILAAPLASGDEIEAIFCAIARRKRQ